MEVAQLVLEYIKVLLWPGLLVTAVITFRGRLDEILKNIALSVNRLHKVTAAGITAELIAKLSQNTFGDDDVQEIESNVPTESLDQYTATLINETWKNIEEAIAMLFAQEAHGPTKSSRSSSLSTQVAVLKRSRVIPPDVARAIDSSLEIKVRLNNDAEKIPLGVIDDYVRTLGYLNATLRNHEQFASNQNST